MSAKVIELEGIDGSGKTTAYNYLIETLRAQGKKVLATREVGNPNIPVCAALRKIVLDPESKMDGMSMEFVFAAMRIENQRLYRAVENEYDFIVSDRGILSHLAYTDHNVTPVFTKLFYQGVINQYTQGPDLVLFLEIEPETALKRRHDRNGFVDVIEAKGPVFQENVYKSFIKYIRQMESNEGLKYNLVNANQTIEGVQKQLDNIVENILSGKVFRPL
jgi:dTMP kinase